jgi:hypothetical protein
MQFGHEHLLCGCGWDHVLMGRTYREDLLEDVRRRIAEDHLRSAMATEATRCRRCMTPLYTFSFLYSRVMSGMCVPCFFGTMPG